MIGAYYNISCACVPSLLNDINDSCRCYCRSLHVISLKECTKMKGLLEVVSSSAEFESIPIRRHEDVLLHHIYDCVPVKLDRVNFEVRSFKMFLLLQAHFLRLQLPPDLAADQVLVLKISNLLLACVDAMSSNAWMNALGATVDLSQMCVQAMWETDSPLKQVPHFDLLMKVQ
jgi:pre-mRNA-splicing helicase BRR2